MQPLIPAEILLVEGATADGPGIKRNTISEDMQIVLVNKRYYIWISDRLLGLLPQWARAARNKAATLPNWWGVPVCRVLLVAFHDHISEYQYKPFAIRQGVDPKAYCDQQLEACERALQDDVSYIYAAYRNYRVFGES